MQHEEMQYSRLMKYRETVKCARTLSLENTWIKGNATEIYEIIYSLFQFESKRASDECTGRTVVVSRTVELFAQE